MAQALAGELVAGSPRPVGLGELDEELLRLWAELGQEARAAIASLVVFAPRGGPELDDLLARVGAEQAARIIVAIPSAGAAPGRLEAALSAHCLVRSGGRKLCSEQITLRASGDAWDGLHATVGRLLLSDLPVYLWWQGELGGHLFEEMLELADRLVIDSAALTPADLPTLARLSAPGLALGDLNWRRLEPWLVYVAGCFDYPLMRPSLDGLRLVEVEGGPDNQGLLLAGWLGSRLGWQIGGAGSLSGPAGEVRVLHRPSEGLGPDRLRLEADRAAVEIVRVEDEACVNLSASIQGERRMQRLAQHSPLETARTLARELESILPDRTYREALRFASRWVEARS